MSAVSVENLVGDVFATGGYRPSSLQPLEGGSAEVKSAPTEALRDSVATVASWRADPGTYIAPASPVGETFAVIRGAGVFEIEGQDGVSVRPGSIVVIPPNTPARLIVTEELFKVLVVPRPAA